MLKKRYFILSIAIALTFGSILPASQDIHTYILLDDTTKIKELITNGTDINIKNNFNETPLLRAARLGKKEIVELLLAHGALVNEKNHDGNTALSLAAHHNNKEIVELLLTHNGTDINIKNNFNETPLHKAARKGRKEIAELLLTHGALVNEKNHEGNTALSLAVLHNNKEIVELLLTHGALINDKNNTGFSPSDYAKMFNRTEICSIFEKNNHHLFAIGLSITAFAHLCYTYWKSKKRTPSKKIVNDIRSQATQEQNNPYLAYTSRIFYKISKNNSFCGYLLGSMHTLQDETLKTSLQKSLLPWIKECKVAFGEIDSILQPQVLYPAGGVENIIGDLIHKHQLPIVHKGFNSDLFNSALLAASPYFAHNFNLLLYSPDLALRLKGAALGFTLPISLLHVLKNIVLQKLIPEKCPLTFDALTALYKNETSPFSGIYDDFFCYERNKLWIETIKKQPLDTPTLYVVGCLHLPGPYGMIDLLEQNGYNCQAMSIFSSPENPVLLDDFYKPITDEERTLYDQTRRTYSKSLILDAQKAYFISVIYMFLKTLISNNNTASYKKLATDPFIYAPCILSTWAQLFNIVA